VKTAVTGLDRARRCRRRRRPSRRTAARKKRPRREQTTMTEMVAFVSRVNASCAAWARALPGVSPVAEKKWTPPRP
jgi:hypothetical protein